MRSCRPHPPRLQFYPRSPLRDRRRTPCPAQSSMSGRADLFVSNAPVAAHMKNEFKSWDRRETRGRRGSSSGRHHKITLRDAAWTLCRGRQAPPVSIVRVLGGWRYLKANHLGERDDQEIWSSAEATVDGWRTRPVEDIVKRDETVAGGRPRSPFVLIALRCIKVYGQLSTRFV